MSLDERPVSGTAALARRWPRHAAIGSATVVIMAAAATAAGGWYYAGELLLVRRDPPEYPVEVVAVTRSSITLAGEGAGQPGIVGLAWTGGYARVGPDIKLVNGHVVRSLIPFPQAPGAGTKARIDLYAAPDDVADFAKAVGFDVEEVFYDGPLGRYPATFVDRPGAAAGARPWVIHVHGRGVSRSEGYRLVPSIYELGHPQLSIAYPNDHGAPPDPGGRYGLGWTEAEDLAGAIAYARDHGAQDVVLVGYSMGCAIIGNYLRTHGSRGVAGVVYDSPALSWPDILAYQAADRGLPAFGAAVAAVAVRVRAGVRLGEMDQVVHAGRLDVPVLLVHGEGDLTVPVTSSDALALARADLVTYLRTEAGHVQNWNVGPARYEAAVAAFLSRLP